MSGKRARRGPLHYVGLGLSGGVLALVALLGAALIAVPFVSGATPLTILTASMEPHLPPGTVIVVKPTPVQDIRLGDVITYQIRSGDPTLVTHRVASVGSSTDGSIRFVTKGDNNSTTDAAPVASAQVKGVVWYSVPWVGFISLALNGPIRAWLVPLIAVALFCYAGFMFAEGAARIIRLLRPGAQSRRGAQPRRAAQPVRSGEHPHGRRRRQNGSRNRFAGQNHLADGQLDRSVAQV